MLLRRLLTIAAVSLLALGFAVMAQAEGRLYNAELIIDGFGNDTTTGTTAPFTTNFPGPYPGGMHCNTHSFHTKSTRTLPTYYNTNTVGTLGNGNYYVFTIPSYGGQIATVHQSGSELFAPGCLPSTDITGSPLTGSGTIITTGSYSSARPHSASPRGFTIPASDLARVTDGASGVYAFPYIFEMQYHDLKNVKGTFSESGGPGRYGPVSFTYAGATGNAGLYVKPGVHAFGGTMRLLGTAYSNEGFKSVLDTYVAHYTWLLDYHGGPANVSTSLTGVLGQTALSGAYTGTDQNFYIGRYGGFANTTTVKAFALSWTTGTVTATAVGGPVYTVMARKGFDDRSVWGSGAIQMVSPMITRWTYADGANEYHTGSIGILKVIITPEPHEWMMLGAGLSMLGLLYRANRRSR